LAVVAIHLTVSRVTDEQFQTQSMKLLEQISTGISVGEFRMFTDAVEMEHHLAERLLSAKASVCDLSWKSRISEEFAATHRRLSHGNLDRAIAEASSRISYREIFIFSDRRRVEKMDRRLNERQDGYSCRYYKEDGRIPRPTVCNC
jgi:hypothetical protein